MLPNNIEVLHELSIMDAHSKKRVSEFAIVEYIEHLEGLLAEYENPKNWTRSYDCYGNLINEHALYVPKLPKDQKVTYA